MNYAGRCQGGPNDNKLMVWDKSFKEWFQEDKGYIGMYRFDHDQNMWYWVPKGDGK